MPVYNELCVCAEARAYYTRPCRGALEKSYGVVVVVVIGRFFMGSGKMAILGRKNVVLGQEY